MADRAMGEWAEPSQYNHIFNNVWQDSLGCAEVLKWGGTLALASLSKKNTNPDPLKNAF